jgi:hypothetical protein
MKWWQEIGNRHGFPEEKLVYYHSRFLFFDGVRTSCEDYLAPESLEQPRELVREPFHRKLSMPLAERNIKI